MLVFLSLEHHKISVQNRTDNKTIKCTW